MRQALTRRADERSPRPAGLDEGDGAAGSTNDDEGRSGLIAFEVWLECVRRRTRQERPKLTALDGGAEAMIRTDREPGNVGQPLIRQRQRQLLVLKRHAVRQERGVFTRKRQDIAPRGDDQRAVGRREIGFGASDGPRQEGREPGMPNPITVVKPLAVAREEQTRRRVGPELFAWLERGSRQPHHGSSLAFVKTSSSTTAESVRLRPLRPTDRDAIRRWMADPRVIAFTVVVPGPEYGPLHPYDPVAADHYLQVLIDEPDRRSFAILLDDVHVGNVGLKHVDLRHRTSECFIEIGETSVRRRGVALAAMSQLLDLAFDELRLESVRLGVFEFNAPAIGLYHKLGFTPDGRQGDHYSDGRLWAVNAMRIDALAWYRARGRLERPQTTA